MNRADDTLYDGADRIQRTADGYLAEHVGADGSYRFITAQGTRNEVLNAVARD